MILLVNICKEPLHAEEFVRPVADILRREKIKSFTRHYKKLASKDLAKADKVIICGTSLRDNDFVNDADYFNWLKEYKKPVLGICGGAHLIGLIKGKKIVKKEEIGLKRIDLKKEFLGVKGNIEVYHLHQLQVLPEVYQEDNLYATLFHPEVRNRQMIVNFAKID